jgi:hypothetical protein
MGPVERAAYSMAEQPYCVDVRVMGPTIRVGYFLCAVSLRWLINQRGYVPCSHNLLPLVRTNPRTSLKEGKL